MRSRAGITDCGWGKRGREREGERQGERGERERERERERTSGLSQSVRVLLIFFLTFFVSCSKGEMSQKRTHYCDRGMEFKHLLFRNFFKRHKKELHYCNIQAQF